MGSTQRPIDAATRRARNSLIEIGDQIRIARVEHGLSQFEVGRAVGISSSQVSRIERGEAPSAPVRTLARLLAAVGLDLSLRAYPGGEPIRDAAHIELLRRFRSTCLPGWRWQSEVPVGPAGDRRAWDGVASRPGVTVAVEAETRARDVQALDRRVGLKLRDSGMSRAVLVLSDTRSNRRVVRDYRDALRASFPVDSAAALEALRQGRDPGGNAVVLC